MKYILLAAALGLVPVSAQADGTTYVGGALTYVQPDVGDGFGTVEAYVEYEHSSGLYAGIWLGSLGPDDEPDTIEADLYFGYRTEFGQVSFDAGYTRYYYDDMGDCCGELIISGEVPVGDKVTLGVDLSTDFEGTQYATFNWAVTATDVFEVSGSVTAYNDGGGTEYDFGATASLSDTTAVDLRYYDNDFGDESRVELVLSWDTDLTNL